MSGKTWQYFGIVDKESKSVSEGVHNGVQNTNCYDVACEGTYTSWNQRGFHVLNWNKEYSNPGQTDTVTLHRGQPTDFYVGTHGYPLFKKGSMYQVDIKRRTNPTTTSYLRTYKYPAISPFLIKFNEQLSFSTYDILGILGEVLKFHNCYPPGSKPTNIVAEHDLKTHQSNDEYRRKENLILIQCLATCENTTVYKVAYTLKGKCLCYEKQTVASDYNFKYCTYSEDYEAFYEFKYEDRMMDYPRGNSGYQLEITTKVQEALKNPTFKDYQETKNTLSFHVQLPDDSNWAVSLEQRQIEVSIYAVKIVEPGEKDKYSNLGEESFCENFDPSSSNYLRKTDHTFQVQSIQTATPLGKSSSNGGGADAVFTIPNLRSMTWHCVSVKSVTSSRQSSGIMSSDGYYTSDPSAPSPPINTYVSEITHESFRVTWSAPSNDGGIGIKNYTIFRQQYEEGGFSFAVQSVKTNENSIVIMTTNDDQTKKELQSMGNCKKFR
jgi:hypothetical protein